MSLTIPSKLEFALSFFTLIPAYSDTEYLLWQRNRKKQLQSQWSYTWKLIRSSEGFKCLNITELKNITVKMWMKTLHPFYWQQWQLNQGVLFIRLILDLLETPNIIMHLPIKFYIPIGLSLPWTKLCNTFTESVITTLSTGHGAT